MQYLLFICFCFAFGTIVLFIGSLLNQVNNWSNDMWSDDLSIEDITPRTGTKMKSGYVPSKIQEMTLKDIVAAHGVPVKVYDRLMRSQYELIKKQENWYQKRYITGRFAGNTHTVATTMFLTETGIPLED